MTLSTPRCFKTATAHGRLSTRYGLTVAAMAIAGVSQPSLASQDVAKDIGVVSAATTVTATVWLKGSTYKDLDDKVADLYDPESPGFHDWISPDALASLKPSKMSIDAVSASLSGLGLHVDKIATDGSFIRISGSGAAVQAAFGTTIHQWQTAATRYFKATSRPVFQGAHAELIAGVSGLSGSKVRPFVTRQADVLHRAVPSGTVLAAGADPLDSFTTNCFAAPSTVHMSGFGVSGKPPVVGGEVDAYYNGPTYLDMKTTLGRKICGYTPKQVIDHYGLAEAHALGWTGKGETIVIVDAFGSPTITADANTFSRAMGLPALTASNFNIVNSDGAPTSTDPDWALETSLDVEWAHAIAPDASIALVVTPSEDPSDLALGIQYAVDHHLGSVISNSWGYPESAISSSDAQILNHVIELAAARGVSVNVATGDSGDNGVGSPLGAPNVPSDSPYATAIGGTSLGIPSDSGPVEAAWGTYTTGLGTILIPAAIPLTNSFVAGSGGGESVFWKKPRWQRKLPGVGRQVPDISAMADSLTGAIVVETNPNSGATDFFTVGGTSLATPIFSAIWAIADQAAGEPLGQAAPMMGSLPAFAIRDVLPVAGRRQSVTGKVTLQGVLTNYTAAEMLAVPASQTAGFASALEYVALDYQGVEYKPGYVVLGFGLDSSLAATVGWDNATGEGVPNGLIFIDAARQFARRH